MRNGIKNIVVLVLAVILAGDNVCMSVRAATENSALHILVIPTGKKAILTGLGDVTGEIEKMKEDGYYFEENEIYFVPSAEVGYQKVSIPDTVEYIGDYAFEAEAFEEVTIPGTVKRLGNNVFYFCKYLKKLCIEEGVEIIDYALCRSCYQLETVSMPKSVKEWNTECAFENCESLKNVTFPTEGFTTLGNRMFMGCMELEKLIIPDSVTTMDYNVVGSCPKLRLFKVGYKLEHFEINKKSVLNLNLTDGCFGITTEGDAPTEMVIEAPLDSAIIDYAKNYYAANPDKHWYVKYKGPEFEKMEWECDGKLKRAEHGTYTYQLTIKANPLPKYSWCGNYAIGSATGYKYEGELYGHYYAPLGEFHIYVDSPGYIINQLIYYTVDNELKTTVEHEEWFRVTVSKEEFANQTAKVEVTSMKVQEPINVENLEWETITPILSTTPIPTASPSPLPTPTTILPSLSATAVPPSRPAFTQKPTPVPTIKITKPSKPVLKSVTQGKKKVKGKTVYKKEVKLAWKKVKNADGYAIYMKTGKDGKYKIVKKSAKRNRENYVKKKLKKGKTYYFKIRAYKKINGQYRYGFYSSIKKVKIK